MIFSNKSNLSLTFEIGHCHGRSMNLLIQNNQYQMYYDQIESKTLTYTAPFEFPGQVSITVSGKGANDTTVDSEGNIVEDMYIKLTNIQVDQLNCDPYYLNKNIVLQTNDGQKHILQYWGFNGKIILDLPQSNSFYWHTEAARLAQ
jgi:hypothetical protein